MWFLTKFYKGENMEDTQVIGIGTKIYKPLDTEEKSVFYMQCAIWCNENGADLVDKGDYYEICERVAPPLPELEVYKERRKNELNTIHEAAEAEAHILSSLGFEVDANDRANRDVTGLLVTTPADGVVTFMDYSNEMHTLTRDDLEVLQKEIIENAQYLYSQKWTYRAQIEACESSYALSQLNFQFAYKSFYTETQEESDGGSAEQTE